MEPKQAVGFVTKKVLVTFGSEICIPMNGTAGFLRSAICEYQEATDRADTWRGLSDVPRDLTVVALPNGPKLTRTVHLRVAGWMVIAAMVFLDENSLKAETV